METITAVDVTGGYRGWWRTDNYCWQLVQFVMDWVALDTFLPVPMLLAESLALWVITKQLRYAVLTAFVFFTYGWDDYSCISTNLPEWERGDFSCYGLFSRILQIWQCMHACIWYCSLGWWYEHRGGYGSEMMRRYEVWRRVSALTFIIMGLFVSFTAPAFPGTSSSSSWDDGSAFFNLFQVWTWKMMMQPLVDGV